MSIKKIESKEDWNKLITEEETFFIMKNSVTCPVSSEAFTEMESYAKSEPPFPIFYLNVQDLKELSNQISEECNIKHESPQVLLFHKNDVVWNASHWKVTKKNAEKASNEIA
ncbi:bacillithiol system redox-active protein YtxJ [Salipaludibacillus sp. HK11]|uniref:bacillithiol system redox-active protein YtxJ n=1 Tax=Salipaludibacillus sp. HK11 TaxID=3394320 RepID=UPI0039FBED71